MKSPPIQWLHDAAATRPEDFAIRFAESPWSFARLADEVARTASVLVDRGFEPGSRVGLVLGAGPAFVTSLLGALSTGIVAVPLSPLYTPREIALHIGRNAIKGMITDPSNARGCSNAMAVAARDGTVLAIGESRFATDISSSIASAAPSGPVDVGLDDTAVVLHTAGSTGHSKLVPRTQRQLLAECDAVAATAGTTADDVIFGMLPLYHCHGLFNCLFAALRAGCRLSIFLDPRPIVLAREDAAAMMARERATIVPSIPFQLERLIPVKGHYDLSSIRLCYTGGAALKESTYEAFAERFGIRIRQQYGCTEAGAVTLNMDEDIDASHMTAGTGIRGVEVSICDAGASGEGEIFVASPALTDGYEGLDALNEQVFVDGGFKTGDLGRIDEAGRLIVTRRRPIYVDVAGHKVDSSEVEDVLCELPGVTEAMVVGTHSTPAAMKALIACAEPLDSKSVREFCRQRLASYKIPSIFEFCEKVPRDALGKRLRKELV